jgi:hypothetical protein
LRRLQIVGTSEQWLFSRLSNLEAVAEHATFKVSETSPFALTEAGRAQHFTDDEGQGEPKSIGEILKSD